jgi:hypothetical protein
MVQGSYLTAPWLAFEFCQAHVADVFADFDGFAETVDQALM